MAPETSSHARKLTGFPRTENTQPAEPHMTKPIIVDVPCLIHIWNQLVYQPSVLQI